MKSYLAYAALLVMSYKRTSLVVALSLIVAGIGMMKSCEGDEKKDVKEKKSEFYCESVTGELCAENCKPWSVRKFTPGFVLRYATDGGIYLFTTCARDAEQNSFGVFKDACECDAR